MGSNFVFVYTSIYLCIKGISKYTPILSIIIKMRIMKKETLLLEVVKTILFFMFFFIALYLSHHHNSCLFGLTAGGMIVYALLIVGTLFWRNRQK